jgi:diaminopimelate decarboxylase
MPAFRIHITRMHSPPLDPDKKQKEWETIKAIAKNNNFPQHLLLKLNRQTQHKTSNTKTGKKDKKSGTTFNFQSSKLRKITNMFKNTNIGIRFKTTNHCNTS